MLPMSETTTSPNPQSSILICEKGADKVVGESIGGGVGLDLFAAQMIESIRCTYPERTILIWSQRKDEIAEQAILRGQMAGLAAFIAKKAVILATQPDNSAAAWRDASNRNTQKRGQRSEFLLLENM